MVVSSITTLKISAIMASSGPARSSLPHGAGKCPIMNVKDSPVVVTLTSRIADMIATISTISACTL